MNRRDFIGGALALAGGAAFGDEYVATKGKLPPGSIGDPANVNFARHIFPLGHTIEDGESAALKDGEVYLPRRKVPVFHTTDVCVVGGGPAGFAAAVAAAKRGCTPRELPYAELKRQLIANGVFV